MASEPENPTLLESLRMECDFVRGHPKTDDDSAIWLRVADLEEILDYAELAAKMGLIPG